MKRPFPLSRVMPLGLSLRCVSAVSFFAETKTPTSNITAALSEKGKALVEADSARLQEIFKDNPSESRARIHGNADRRVGGKGTAGARL